MSKRPLLLLVAIAIAYSPVDTHAIRAAFERAHPGCRVKALAVGEAVSRSRRFGHQLACQAVRNGGIMNFAQSSNRCWLPQLIL